MIPISLLWNGSLGRVKRKLCHFLLHQSLSDVGSRVNGRSRRFDLPALPFEIDTEFNTQVMKIVRAIRQGRILPSKPKTTSSQPQFFAIWNDEPSSSNTPPIPAPKLRLPTHSESYNPPEEYLPTEEERKEWEATDKEDRERDYLPQKYSSLRLVPAYDQFIQERFSRQLDLYLAPRIQRTKLNIDPNSLIPKLPSPNTLRPFPNYKSFSFTHGRGRVRCGSVSPDGAWVVSASEEGVVCLWEVIVGREVKRWSLDEKVNAVDWCPRTDVSFFVVGT
jgi:ribosome biogenesis protein ERB1